MTPRLLRYTAASVVLTAAATIGVDVAGATTPPASRTAAVESGIDAERCAANQAAGEIVYLSGFQYAASASMVDVMVALANGYYDELCLDVTYEPSFSTQNYPLVAAGRAQFASAGSFSEMIQFATANEADLVAVLVKGNFPIDTVIVKDPTLTEPAQLADAVIGIKNRLPASVEVMLADVGLTEHEDYATALLDGFDPLAHHAIDSIDGFTGHFSNEPGALAAAGIEVGLIRPVDHGVPGSHGVTYTSREFATAHPTAAEDFVRATLRGFADAMADPEAAVAIAEQTAAAVDFPSFDLATETYRWTTEAAMIAADSADRPLGVPDVDALQAELDAYAAVDYFDAPPPAAHTVTARFATDAYDDGELVSPG